MAEIILIAVLILSVLWGAHKGLVESIGGVARIIVSFFGAAWVANELSTPMSGWIRPMVEHALQDKIAGIGMDNMEETLQSFFLVPDHLTETISEILGNVVNQGMSVAAATVESITHSVTYAVVYVLAFVILMIVLWLVMKPLQLMTKLPGLHLLNTLGGGAVGLIWGVLLAFLAVWAMTQFDLFLTPEMVKESELLQFFVYNSPIKWITSL